MAAGNNNKNIWFTQELFQEKWESRIKIKKPTKLEQVKIIYDFLKLQAGQSNDSTYNNIRKIARCASLIKSTENDEFWFKNYFEEIESIADQDDTLSNLPNDWIIVPNINQFIQFKIPYTEQDLMRYFDIFNEALTASSIENFKILPAIFEIIPVIAMICLQCLAKKPNSVSYSLKQYSIELSGSYRFIPPLSKELFEALSDLPNEPMKCNSEAINVLLMFLKFYDDSGENNLAEELKKFADKWLLSHLKGNGIQLAYIFFRVQGKFRRSPSEVLEIYRTPVVSSKINKSINRLKEFIDFYGNTLNDSSLLWWSRLLDRKWMNEFSTTLNKKLIIRMSALVTGCRYMHVVRNSKKNVLEAAKDYASAVYDINCPDLYLKFFNGELPSIISNDHIRKKQCIGESNKLILAHLNL